MTNTKRQMLAFRLMGTVESRVSKINSLKIAFNFYRGGKGNT